MDDHPRYSISVAAELTGLHPQTLRMYEARGLVRPRRTPGGTRRYSDSDVARLRRITSLTTEYGMNLNGALAVLELEGRIAQLSRQVARLQAQLVDAAQRSRADLADVHRSYRRELVLYQPPQPPTPTKQRYRWTSQS